MTEEWKPVVGYESQYLVSNLGNVFGLKRNKLISISIRKDGYAKVGLYKSGARKHFGVHRLVAESFIPNPLNCPQVNHKDENKANNNVANLEWCTPKENVMFGTRTKRASNSCKKYIEQIDSNGNVINVFHGAKSAAMLVGAKKRNICACCTGTQKTSKGFYWRYKESEVKG